MTTSPAEPPESTLAESERTDLAAAEAKLAAVEATHRHEWADYIENREGAVGPKPLSVRMIVALLRAQYPPFGCSATPPQGGEGA